jgi:hypothetical protein
MLTSNLRSRLVGLANKPFLLSRVFSTAPIHRRRFDLEQAFAGKLNLDWTPESGCDNAGSIVRGKASLREPDAHNCSLYFTADLLESLPKLRSDVWKLQASIAQWIIEHHQYRALLRAGFSVSSTTATQSHRPDTANSLD